MWNENIDIYCERVDISFWSEPINALTNLAFIFASLYALYIHKKEGLNNKAYVFLSFLLFCIGIGSFLFHTFANKWSSLVDTIPIWSFVVFYILFAIRIVFNYSWLRTIRVMTIVLVFSYIGFYLANTEGSDDKLLNGSLQYAPALFFLFFYTFTLYKKKKDLYKYALIASLVFLCSLFFRTIDISICNNLSFGSHFMWHILNAIMLYYLLYIIHLSIKVKT